LEPLLKAGERASAGILKKTGVATMAKKKPYSLKLSGPEGPGVEKFETLAQAGVYLAERYQGAGYLQGDSVMGTDYVNYTLVGFKLSDVGKFWFDEGWKEFGFFDWCGGSIVDLGKGEFHVVQLHECGEFPVSSNVIKACVTLEQAIEFGQAMTASAELEWYEIHKGGVVIGYIDSDSHGYVEKKPKDVFVASDLESEPPPF
jgi:hypothetical protein